MIGFTINSTKMETEGDLAVLVMHGDVFAAVEEFVHLEPLVTCDNDKVGRYITFPGIATLLASNTFVILDLIDGIIYDPFGKMQSTAN